MKRGKIILILFLMVLVSGVNAAETFYVCQGGIGSNPESGKCHEAFNIIQIQNSTYWSFNCNPLDDGKISSNDIVVFKDEGGVIRDDINGVSIKILCDNMTFKAEEGDSPVLDGSISWNPSWTRCIHSNCQKNHDGETNVYQAISPGNNIEVLYIVDADNSLYGIEYILDFPSNAFCWNNDNNGRDCGTSPTWPNYANTVMKELSRPEDDLDYNDPSGPYPIWTIPVKMFHKSANDPVYIAWGNGTNPNGFIYRYNIAGKNLIKIENVEGFSIKGLTLQGANVPIFVTGGENAGSIYSFDSNIFYSGVQGINIWNVPSAKIEITNNLFKLKHHMDGNCAGAWTGRGVVSNPDVINHPKKDVWACRLAYYRWGHNEDGGEAMGHIDLNYIGHSANPGDVTVLKGNTFETSYGAIRLTYPNTPILKIINNKFNNGSSVGIIISYTLGTNTDYDRSSNTIYIDKNSFINHNIAIRNHRWNPHFDYKPTIYITRNVFWREVISPKYPRGLGDTIFYHWIPNPDDFGIKNFPPTKESIYAHNTIIGGQGFIATSSEEKYWPSECDPEVTCQNGLAHDKTQIINNILYKQGLGIAPGVYDIQGCDFNYLTYSGSDIFSSICQDTQNNWYDSTDISFNESDIETEFNPSGSNAVGNGINLAATYSIKGVSKHIPLNNFNPDYCGNSNCSVKNSVDIGAIQTGIRPENCQAILPTPNQIKVDCSPDPDYNTDHYHIYWKKDNSGYFLRLDNVKTFPQIFTSLQGGTYCFKVKIADEDNWEPGIFSNEVCKTIIGNQNIYDINTDGFTDIEDVRICMNIIIGVENNQTFIDKCKTVVDDNIVDLNDVKEIVNNIFN